MKRSLYLPSILIVISLWGLLSLGFWQLGRADEKRTIKEAIVLAQSKPAQLIEQVDQLATREHYQVLLNGYYDPERQFIYDNQIVQSNAGYYVLTPFILAKDTAILVNRGFVPWHGNRDKLADISLSAKATTIKVKLILPKQRILLKQQKINPIFPLLIQSLDLTQLSQLSGYKIIPILAQLDVNADNGFYRKWQPFYGTVDKHLGYALQWFLMALVLFIIAARLVVKNW